MIPKTYYKYKEMPIWENDTIAPGLLKIHSTKVGVYGNINVMQEELEYTVYDGADGNEISTTILSPSNPGIAKPQDSRRLFTQKCISKKAPTEVVGFLYSNKEHQWYIGVQLVV